jgi:hypothetical protein
MKSLEDRLGDPEGHLYLSPFAVAAADVARVRLEVENSYLHWCYNCPGLSLYLFRHTC